MSAQAAVAAREAQQAVQLEDQLVALREAPLVVQPAVRQEAPVIRRGPIPRFITAGIRQATAVSITRPTGGHKEMCRQATVARLALDSHGQALAAAEAAQAVALRVDRQAVQLAAQPEVLLEDPPAVQQEARHPQASYLALTKI